MDRFKKLLLVLMVSIFAGLLVSCGSEESEKVESTAEPSIVETAKEAVDGASDSIGAVVEQAAEGAQTAVDSASETAQNTAEQVGEALEAAGSVIVDQGGNLVEVVGSAGQSTAGALQERIASLQPDEDGNFSVIIHEDEINSIIEIQELFTGPIPGNPLKNTTVTFSEGVIVFSADVFKPIVGQLTIKFSSSVDGDHVRFEVIDASLGGKETPQSVLDTAASTLDSTLGEALRFLPASLKPREIVVTNGTFTLTGGGAEQGE
jgi:hypothetical protein